LPITFFILLATYGIFLYVTIITTQAQPWAGFAVGVITAALILLLYIRLIRWLEGSRHLSELTTARAGAGLSGGGLLGLALMSTVVSVLYLSGYYSVRGTGAVSDALATLGLWCIAGVGEELTFRGGLFRLLEEAVGTWIALVVSALIFGGVHLANPQATLWGATAIAIEAGLLFGAIYVATRNLWACIGLHWMWNFSLGSLYGLAVSGSGVGDDASILDATIAGPTLITGGEFGPEASLVCIAICLIPSAIFLVIAHRRGLIRPMRTL
jgi:membrane protease YdiL (CAAX protease family)